MLRLISKISGYIFLAIAGLIWATLFYEVISKDLGQIATLKLYWKDIGLMSIIGMSGGYLVDRNKS